MARLGCAPGRPRLLCTGPTDKKAWDGASAVHGSTEASVASDFEAGDTRGGGNKGRRGGRGGRGEAAYTPSSSSPRFSRGLSANDKSDLLHFQAREALSHPTALDPSLSAARP